MCLNVSRSWVENLFPGFDRRARPVAGVSVTVERWILRLTPPHEPEATAGRDLLSLQAALSREGHRECWYGDGVVCVGRVFGEWGAQGPDRQLDGGWVERRAHVQDDEQGRHGHSQAQPAAAGGFAFLSENPLVFVTQLCTTSGTQVLVGGERLWIRSTAHRFNDRRLWFFFPWSDQASNLSRLD